MLLRIADTVPTRVLCALIVVLCAVVYVPHLANRFVSLDDGLLIYRNPAIQQLTPRSVAYVFTTYDPELYVPLTLFSYQLEHAFFGLRPGVFHLTNLLLHALNALLVFGIVTRLARDRLIGIIAGLLFAIHPLHTEAVLWAAARKDVLSSFFFLSSLAFYLQYRSEEEKRWYYGSVAAFLLGLLSKVSIILLPVVLIFIDLLRGRRLDRRAWMEKIPYAVFSAIFGIIALGGKSQAIAGIGPMENLLLSAKSAAFYLQKIFVPVGFSPIYPQSTAVTVASLEFLIPIIVIVGLAIAAWILRRRLPLVTFGIVFFLLMLVPAFSTFFKNGFLFFASDRYAYLASIGVFLIVGLIVSMLAQRRSIASTITAAATAAVVLFLAASSFVQGSTWRDSEALYRSVLQLYPDSAMAHNNLGDALRKSERLDEAEAEIRSALALDPDLLASHINSGLIKQDRGDIAGAIAAFRHAIAAVDHKPTLNIDEVASYYLLAQALELSGDDAGGLAQYKLATEKAPNFAEPYYNLGLALQKRGRRTEAIDAFKKAVAIDPRAIDARYRLASLLAELGRLPEAVTQLEAIIAIDPGYENADAHLRNIRGMIGQ